jgi:hypothetical protein
MVTGVSLHLHLLSYEHPEEHDTEHCPLCQQLLFKPGKFITEPESGVPDDGPLIDDVEFYSQPYVTAFHFESFSPRPPPSPFSN